MEGGGGFGGGGVKAGHKALLHEDGRLHAV